MLRSRSVSRARVPVNGGDVSEGLHQGPLTPLGTGVELAPAQGVDTRNFTRIPKICTSHTPRRMPVCRSELRKRVCAGVAAGILLLVAPIAPVRAQELPDDRPAADFPSPSTASTCPAGRISEVIIQNGSVFDLTGREGRFSWAFNLANTLHIRTRPDVIERELLFRVGACYDVDQLRASERPLRSFGFIARADIYGVRAGGDSVQVVVDTQDEWSTRIQPEVDSRDGLELSGITAVEDNIFGTGRHVALFYDRENDQRVYGAEFISPQVLGTRTDLAFKGARTEVGYSLHQAVAYPFVGESGKWAFRQQVGRSDDYFELLVSDPQSDLERIWLPVRRLETEVGAAFRWGGERYRHALVGVALVGERITYPGEAIYPDSLNRPIVPLTRFLPKWSPVRSTRAVLLLGGRSVEFVRRRSLETINSIEDLQLGVEGEISLGPTIPLFSGDRDLALAAGLNIASELRPSLIVGGQVAVEGRRRDSEADRPDWGDVMGEIDLWAYLRSGPESPHTTVGSISAVGGWNASSPFQLTLGGDAGLRGFPRHLDPGGRRVVASIEHRRYLGWPLPDLFDLGGVAFLDAGKIWPGDVPFGIESPVRATAGVGLRAAFPAGSRQTFRADVGIPLRGGAGVKDLVISIGVGQVIGRRVTGPDPQILRSARYALTSSRFLYSGGWW